MDTPICLCIKYYILISSCSDGLTTNEYLLTVFGIAVAKKSRPRIKYMFEHVLVVLAVLRYNKPLTLITFTTYESVSMCACSTLYEYAVFSFTQLLIQFFTV